MSHTTIHYYDYDYESHKDIFIILKIHGAFFTHQASESYQRNLYRISMTPKKKWNIFSHIFIQNSDTYSWDWRKRSWKIRLVVVVVENCYSFNVVSCNNNFFIFFWCFLNIHTHTMTHFLCIFRIYVNVFCPFLLT